MTSRDQGRSPLRGSQVSRYSREASQIRIANVLFHHPPRDIAPAEILGAWPTLVENAAALERCGTRVTTYINSWRDESVDRDGTSFHFVREAKLDRLGRRSSIAGRLRRDGADLIHVQGLGFPIHLWWLARAIPNTPVVVQDHANQPFTGWRRLAQRRGMHRVAAALFTAREQALPFREAGVFRPKLPVYEVLEASARLQAVDREQGRRATGLRGDPCVLWVGHLDDNKDPRTVLRGFGRCVGSLPDPHLWLCYGSAAGEEGLRALASADRSLDGRVHFVGTVEHASLAAYYSAADVFVLGSHREGSGYALLEALACGLEPAVTDIPSFRRITRSGLVGELFPPGDAMAMADTLVKVARRASPERRGAVRAHFETHLSWDVVGRELQAVYQTVLAGP